MPYKDPVKAAEYLREWRIKTRERRLARQRAYYHIIKHSQKDKLVARGKEVMRRHRLSIRGKLLELLGNTNCVCVRCGFSDIRALQIDHIDGGGCLIRKQMRTYDEYKYYLNHPDEAKKNLQILCANCNWIKRSEKLECVGWHNRPQAPMIKA